MPNSPYAYSVARWVEEQKLELQEQSIYDWEVSKILTYARVRCWQAHNGLSTKEKSQLRATLNFITDHRPPLRDLGWWGLLLEVEVVSALMLQTLGENTGALAALARALTIAEPQGFVRTFVDEGLTMRNLLKQASARGPHRASAQKLSAAFIHADAASQKPPGQKKLLDPLSERELQVLRLLNTTLSVPEIAAELHLAPTTVRTHIRNIYSKLEAHGRIEALQKAAAFDLF
jgi:LuxR family maltose regulon positive regulatory protein